jgi:hypothetical protein
MNASEKAAKQVVADAVRDLANSLPGRALVESLRDVVAEIPRLTAEEIKAVAVVVIYATSPYRHFVTEALNK